MMRLIDADALEISMIETIARMMVTKRWMRRDKENEDEIINVIHSAPTIEAEPVRHGKWVLCEGFRICNGCGASPADWEQKPNNPLGLPPYCHSCGAKMNLEG